MKEACIEDVTFSLAGSREGAGGAATLLEVEAAAAAPDTQCVRLVPPLPEASRTLPLHSFIHIPFNYSLPFIQILIQREKVCVCVCVCVIVRERERELPLKQMQKKP